MSKSHGLSVVFGVKFMEFLVVLHARCVDRANDHWTNVTTMYKFNFILFEHHAQSLFFCKIDDFGRGRCDERKTNESYKLKHLHFLEDLRKLNVN